MDQLAIERHIRHFNRLTYSSSTWDLRSNEPIQGPRSNSSYLHRAASRPGGHQDTIWTSTPDTVVPRTAGAPEEQPGKRILPTKRARVEARRPEPDRLFDKEAASPDLNASIQAAKHYQYSLNVCESKEDIELPRSFSIRKKAQ